MICLLFATPLPSNRTSGQATVHQDSLRLGHPEQRSIAILKASRNLKLPEVLRKGEALSGDSRAGRLGWLRIKNSTPTLIVANR